ncbi:MAG TPA: hypothetical protein VJ552_05855 [Sediminibacterium sp.]|nr:hypothetical protein [Sediminibacterium sp.]
MSILKSLLIAGGVMVGTTVTFAVIHHKRKADLKKNILDLLRAEEKGNMPEILNKMSLVELEDTYAVLQLVKAEKPLSDPCLRQRFEAIDQKYQIVGT